MKKIQIAVSVLIVLALAFTLTVSTLMVSADEHRIAFNLLPETELDIEPRQASDEGNFEVSMSDNGELILTLTEEGGQSGYFGARFTINDEVNIIDAPYIRFSFRAEGLVDGQLELERGLVFNLNININVGGTRFPLQLRAINQFLDMIEVDENDIPIVPQSGTLDFAEAFRRTGNAIPEDGMVTIEELVFWGAATDSATMDHPGFPGTQFIWEYLYFEGEPQQDGNGNGGNDEPVSDYAVESENNREPSDNDIPWTWILIGGIGLVVIVIVIVIIMIVSKKDPNGDDDAISALDDTSSATDDSSENDAE